MTTVTEPAGFRGWAMTPPMGWNSWDCFGTTVTEEQTLAQARVMASQLKAHGWTYVVVDIQWYEPEPKGHSYRPGAPLTMDDWGRLLPAPNRFPSAVGSDGFRVLASQIHDLGLKFGIHLMRGIPRLAVERNLPIWGTTYRARDIANTTDTCLWNPDMYGVDMTRPGAQEYYDSVFSLYAAWGIDYVKVDDIARPYHAHERETEAIRAAIDRAQRPIVLSLSPGETAITAAEHVKRHANLWRISDDFWDNWLSLREQFARLERWNPHRVMGGWPDADMLPFGVLELGRRSTRFTRDEQILVMSLWCIARSPLMFGGDLTRLDEFTRSLLVNDRVIQVNQASESNRLLFNREGLMAWLAETPGTEDRYLALINGRDRRPLTPESATYSSTLEVNQVASIDVAIEDAESIVLVADDGRDNALHHYAVWGEPEISDGQGGLLRLTDLEPVRAISWWADVAVSHKTDGAAGTQSPDQSPLEVSGTPMSHGFGAHTMAWIEFQIPKAMKHLRAKIGVRALDPAGAAGVSSVRFMVHAVRHGADAQPEGLPIQVTAEEIGFAPGFSVLDLWSGRELGVFDQHFAPEIPFHGAGLYRISGRRR